MDVLVAILLGETAVILALVIIILIFYICLLWKKTVVGPKLTVATDKSVYERQETVQISGTLTKDGVGMEGETVNLTIETPLEEVITLPSVLTDAQGKYASSWDIPTESPLGEYKVTATAVGVEATTTFTFHNKQNADMCQ